MNKSKKSEKKSKNLFKRIVLKEHPQKGCGQMVRWSVYFRTIHLPFTTIIRKQEKAPLRGASPKKESYIENQLFSSIVQIPTRFHAGSEKISPTP